jgi:predicted transcriptional regulator
MQTTLRLDDDLYRRAKTAAAEQGVSLTKLVEDAVRERLDRAAPSSRRRRLRLPVSTSTGGPAPGFSNLQEAAEAADLAADLRQTR